MKDRSIFTLTFAVSAILVVSGAALTDTLMLGFGELTFVLSCIGLLKTNEA